MHLLNKSRILHCLNDDKSNLTSTAAVGSQHLKVEVAD